MKKRSKTAYNKSITTNQYKLLLSEIKLLRNDLCMFFEYYKDINENEMLDTDIISIKPKLYCMENKIIEMDNTNIPLNYEIKIFKGV